MPALKLTTHIPAGCCAMGLCGPEALDAARRQEAAYTAKRRRGAPQ